MVDAQTRQLIDEVKKAIEVEVNKPFVVSVMGQTGVGKSSLINALFGTRLKTDPVRPCTKEIEQVVVKGKSGHELWFYDLPGIGESEGADCRYLEEYRNSLLQSDVVVWMVHVDNRSVAFDLSALDRILSSFDKTRQIQLMSRITFVLSKADLLAPPPWILAKVGNQGVFAPSQVTKDVLRQKESYYQEVFLRPYGTLISSQTYNDGSFDVTRPPLHYDEYAIYYDGFLDGSEVANLKRQYPRHAAIFDRLYDNYTVIPCSSLFRYNLARLMLVIINKLGPNAIARFENFVSEDVMNRVPLREAKEYCNIVIYDSAQDRLVFDLTQLRV